MTIPRTRRTRRFAILLGAAALLAGPSLGHDVVSDVSVRMLLKPEGQQMQVYVRVPLRSLRDVEFPLQANGYLAMERAAPMLPEAAGVWIGSFLDLRENGVRILRPKLMGARIALPSDRALATFATAKEHFQKAALPDSINLHPAQAFFDVAYSFPIASATSDFTINPSMNHLGALVSTSLLFQTADGAERAYEFHGDPGQVPLDPRWTQAVGHFIVLGFYHILEGSDHLLFLACLIIPFRKLRPLVWIVSAFTLAHSVTLLASAYGFAPDAAWFPPLVETLIAVSILYMALENIVGASQRRWLFAFAFGLIHGFGFSFALRESLQMAGSHLVTSLLAFNIGVEIGQLAVLIVLVPILDFVFQKMVAERIGTIILSAFIAHTAWDWLAERWDVLLRYRNDLPGLGGGAVPWAVGAVVILALAWGARGKFHAGKDVKASLKPQG